MIEGPYKKDRLPPRFDSVGFMVTDDRSNQQILIQCDGTHHRRMYHNIATNTYSEPGDLYPCNPAEHSAVFQKRPE